MAVQFNASGDYIDYGDVTQVNSLTQMSWTFWIKPTVDDSLLHWIVKKRNAGITQGWSILRPNTTSNGDVNTKCLSFYGHWSTANGIWNTPTNSIVNNILYFCAITYDAGSVSNNPVMYINAVSKTVTKANSPTGSWSSNSGNPLRISSDTSNSEWIGYVQDLRIYSGILSQSTISALYNSGKGNLQGYDTNLVFHGPLLTASQTSSGGSIYPFTGTLVNGTNYTLDRINGAKGTPNGSTNGASDLIFGTGY